MTVLEQAEACAGALLVITGFVSASRALRQVEGGDSARIRTLISLHAVARGGFWLSIGAIFLAYAFRGRFSGDPRVLFPIPLVMSGLRVITGHAVARRLPEPSGGPLPDA